MTDYQYGGDTVAIVPGSNPVQIAKSTTGQVFAITDTALASPLTVTDRNGIERTTVYINDVGAMEPFISTSGPQVLWSGGGLVLTLTSPTSLIESAQDAAAAAQAAQVAAENAEALAAAAPALLPGGGEDGDVLVRQGDRTGVWAPAPSGGGGLQTWSTLPGKPPTFPPDPHTHPASAISDATSVGQAVVKANDKASARSAIGAAPDTTVSFPGFGTGAGQAAQGNHTHSASVIGYTPVAGNGMASTDVNSALNELAARPTGGSGSAPAGTWVGVTYDFTNNVWPTRPTGLPTNARVLWEGPTPVTIGGLYAVGGLDRYERRDTA